MIHCNKRKNDLKNYYFDDVIVVESFEHDDKEVTKINTVINNFIKTFNSLDDFIDYLYENYSFRKEKESINFIAEKEKPKIKVFIEQAYDLLCWDEDILKACFIFGEDFNSISITFDFIEFCSAEKLSSKKIKDLKKFIDEKVKKFKYVALIPSTISQLTERLILRGLKYDDEFRDMVTTPISEDEYRFFQKCKRGGFCGCSMKHKQKLLKNVKSYDLKSMYPSHQCVTKIPLGAGTKVKAGYEMMKKLDSTKLLTAGKFLLKGVKLKNDKSTGYIDKKFVKELQRDGRLNNKNIIDDYVISADEVIGYFTIDDMEVIERFYEIDDIKLYYFYWWQTAVITQSYRSVLLKIYQLKENGDGDAKIMVNLTSGLWGKDFEKYLKDGEDFTEELLKYCDDKNKLGLLSWYVFLTAGCRKRLMVIIDELGDKWVYSDTDSIKVIFDDDVKRLIDEKNLKWNRFFEHQLTAKQWQLAQSKNGQCAGEWCDEGTSNKFFVVGKKQYLCEKIKNKKIVIDVTFSGCNCDRAAAWLEKNGGIDALATAITSGLDYVFPREAEVKINRIYGKTGYREKYAKYSVKYDAKFTKFLGGVVKSRN